jgi:hypothetical protein
VVGVNHLNSHKLPGGVDGEIGKNPFISLFDQYLDFWPAIISHARTIFRIVWLGAG